VAHSQLAAKPTILGAQPPDGIVGFHRHPNVIVVESDLLGPVANRKRPEHRSIARQQLGQVITTLVADPDVNSVKANALRPRANVEGAKNRPIARPQLSDIIGQEIRCPNVPSVKGNKHRVRADVVHCLDGAITRPQFCHGVGRLVGYPKGSFRRKRCLWELLRRGMCPRPCHRWRGVRSQCRRNSL